MAAPASDPSDRPDVARWAAWGIAVLIFLLPATLAVVGAQQLWLFVAARSYREVTGRVLSVDVERVRGDGGSAGPRVSYTYRPVVAYEYAVRGMTFRSRRLTLLGESGSESWARGMVASYGPGVLVTVRYDADAPTRAYLEMGGAPLIPAMMLLIGGGVLVAWGVVVARHRSRAARAAAGARLGPATHGP